MRPKPPVPEMVGRLDEYEGGGPPLVAVVDLNELKGKVTGGDCVGSGIRMGLLSSTGEFVADSVCSLATSAKGASPCDFLGVDTVDVLVVTGLGAGLVYTGACQSAETRA